VRLDPDTRRITGIERPVVREVRDVVRGVPGSGKAREPEEPLADDVQLAAYFVVAESLSNVTKYADAATVSVRVRRDGAALQVEVRDDGRGGAEPAAGTGLRGLADRMAALGGALDVHSPVGAGTRVRATIPLGP
jgi:signal transduction histidine kinase